MIEDFITLANGTTRVVKNGFDFGTVHQHHLRQHRPRASRAYDGTGVPVAGTTSSARWSVNGHYTLMLKNEGNYEGEAPNQPGAQPHRRLPRRVQRGTQLPDGPAAGLPAPQGAALEHLFVRSMGRAGNASVSGLWQAAVR